MPETISECRRVLLIDDDELIVGSLRHYLVTLGCAVDTASDASSATALMRGQRYDVILIDPYLTGAIHDEHEMLGSIGTLQPDASTIVLTAYVSPELERLASRFRTSRLLSKPQSVVYLSELMVTPGLVNVHPVTSTDL
jgi:DNA-binding NtrC family response regulator